MKTPTSREEYEQRRAVLAAEIARQRGDLASAYRDLERPIHYAEVGLKGVSFLRRNQWIFMAAPTALSMVFSLFGLRRKKPMRGEIPNPTEDSRSFLGRMTGRAMQAYQLYRRIRPFFP